MKFELLLFQTPEKIHGVQTFTISCATVVKHGMDTDRSNSFKKYVNAKFIPIVRKEQYHYIH